MKVFVLLLFRARLQFDFSKSARLSYSKLKLSLALSNSSEFSSLQLFLEVLKTKSAVSSPGLYWLAAMLFWRNSELTPAGRVTPPSHGEKSVQLSGLPGPADRATRLGGVPHFSCEGDHDKKRDRMERLVTPPRRGTSTSWGAPPPCEEALSVLDIPERHFNRRTPEN